MVVHNWATSGTSTSAKYLKITENVSPKLQAMRAYILSAQSLMKNAKYVAFLRVFENATFWVIFKQCASDTLSHNCGGQRPKRITKLLQQA